MGTNGWGIKRWATLLLVGCAGVSLSGCARLGAMSRVDPASAAVYPGNFRPEDRGTAASAGQSSNFCPVVRGRSDFRPGAINLDCFRFPEDWEQPAVDDPRAHLAYTRAATNRVARNRLTSILLSQSDEICTIELGQLTANEATVNSSLSILDSGLTTAANVVSGTLARSILTGVANVAGASRDHLNAHVYRSQFSYALARAILIERDRLRRELEGRFDATPEAFSVDAAIRAVNEYHSTCSFYRGLSLVIASVESRENLERHQNALRVQAINREIAQLTSDLTRAAPDQQLAIRARIGALALERSRLSTGVAPAAAPSPAVAAEPDNE